MHLWGDPDVDWNGIDDAAAYIGMGLRKWGRVEVRQFKEKFGTVRVYCSLGIFSLHQLIWPGYMFLQWPRWMEAVRYDVVSTTLRSLGQVIWPVVNKVVLPYHKWLYRRYYRKACERWPHLREEITCAADFPELLA